MDRTLDDILAAGAAGQRVAAADALMLGEACSSPDGLHRLGAAARANRETRFGRRATFVCNLQVNPSNICEGGCRFCCFSADEGSPHAYVLTEEQILQRIRDFAPTEVHIVGGLNRVWGFGRSLGLVREIRRRFPDVYIKAFTAVEIDWFARSERTSAEDVLTAFCDAGLNGMPGGGAEVFSRRMRETYCPGKLSPEGWLRIHREAHRRGLVTNATMLYGCGESWQERVEHLLALRVAQDESRGFACFIPLACQAGRGEGECPGATVTESLCVTALARLILDNFAHIKAYWPMLGLACASAALSWGADDLDGTLGRERIAHAAGAASPAALCRTEMAETIRVGGYTPVERNGRFEAIAVLGGEQ